MAPWLTIFNAKAQRREGARVFIFVLLKKGVVTVAVKKGQKLPDEVVSACGVYGVRLTDVVDYRVGEEFVSIINHRGQKFTAELVKLNPPDYPAKPPPQSPPRSGGKARRKRPARAQETLVDVPGKVE